MAAEEGDQQPPQDPFAGLGYDHELPGKTSWPELVGRTSEEAKSKILEEMPDAVIQVIPPDHFITMDYRTDRVRLYNDSSGKVAREPRIG